MMELSYIDKGNMSRLVEIECPDCDGNGVVEDRRGKETTCISCKGKGSYHAKVKEVNESSELTNTQRDDD